MSPSFLDVEAVWAPEARSLPDAVLMAPVLPGGPEVRVEVAAVVILCCCLNDLVDVLFLVRRFLEAAGFWEAPEFCPWSPDQGLLVSPRLLVIVTGEESRLEDSSLLVLPVSTMSLRLGEGC